MLTELNQFKYIYSAILLTVFLVVFYIANRFTNNLLTPLEFVTSQLKLLSRGELLEEKLEYHGKDEFGEMLASSEQLRNCC